MQKLQYKSLILILTVLVTAGIAFCEPAAETSEINEVPAIEQVQNTDIDKADQIDKLNEEMGLGEQKNIVVEDIKTSPNDNLDLTKKVVPDTKSELVKMVKMFAKVMLAVALSSVVIFILLLIVRRFYTPKVTLEDLNSNDESKATLETPQNKGEALKTFLDKTKGM